MSLDDAADPEPISIPLVLATVAICVGFRLLDGLMAAPKRLLRASKFLDSSASAEHRSPTSMRREVRDEQRIVNKSAGLNSTNTFSAEH